MMACVELDPEDELSDSDVEDVSDSEVGDALDWLDAVEGHDGSTRFSAAFSTAARRPDAHGGVLSRPLQPLSNRTQKLASVIRATPLEYISCDEFLISQEWEGRMNVGMSSAVACVFTTIFNIDPFSVKANVYHATRTDGQELAIKVYKTSVLVFKDRDRYVQGDYRFRHGYCKHNPRKMVKTWAEKEMRNLLRVRAAKIRCPKPLHLRLHVLVMEFIGNFTIFSCSNGKGGWPAPRLKDAALSDDKLRESYFEVDLDHPSALDFLKEDYLHVSDFFRKRGIAVMTATDLFNFVVDQNIADKDVDDYLDEVQQNILENGGAPANDHEVNPTVMVQVGLHSCHLICYKERLLSTGLRKARGVIRSLETNDLSRALQTKDGSKVEAQLIVSAAGIRCPVPLLLRLHVLVMEFIGKGGWAAPRLKDAALSDDKLRESYFEIVTTMRTLYQKCKLVHGDLSEYNILYFEGHLYIIDVSQSVDLDHPSALDFLKEDCLHVSTLDYVKQCEADIVNMSMMQRPSLGYEPPAEKLYDQPFLRFVRTKNTCADEKQQEQLRNKCSLENRVEDDEDDSGSCSNFDEDGSWHEADPKMGPEERKAARKENKKKVKKEKREARKIKIPKAEKKKRKKMAKAKCKR
ncbi:hypothetical protein PR202_ga16416 [Eleusine coracana subsp. coracana]|uniref:Serine/threonine-protein kinase RIO1 n=1 Tax=Eleusine coracana subsp. coracana TaxID=191504 RepID=A0AAV5CLK5_ELECO|nr:hypothetical protein PR202_ga16416 [Eleusine coracana subsp. coracana]